MNLRKLMTVITVWMTVLTMNAQNVRDNLSDWTRGGSSLSATPLTLPRTSDAERSISTT